MTFYTVMTFEECTHAGNIELGNYIHRENALKRFNEEQKEILGRIKDAGINFEDAVVYETADYVSYDIPVEGIVELWIVEKEMNDAWQESDS